VQRGFRVEVTPAARRDLRDLPGQILKRIDRRILALAEDPYPRGAKKVAGGEEILRLRVGDYRILYQVEADRRVVLIVRIRHRRDVYRRS
jgi:mRNA interferase RelE/StbE